MIEELRNEIQQWREQIDDWNEEISEKRAEIEQLEEEIEDLDSNITDAQVTISDKEAEIERLQNESARNNVLEVLTNALSDMSLEDLEALTGHLRVNDGRVTFNSESLYETTTITTDGVDSDDVTFDMLNDDMHNAMITLVGVKYQDLWRVHNRSPEIGDIITLAKRDGRSTQSTVGYTTDGISIGILPASPEKFEQLERIGANSINNRDVDLDNPILERSYKVVGVIPAAFIFLDPVYDEAENIEETVSEAVSQIDSPRHRLAHTAENVEEARHIFNEEMPDHCRIHNIIEQDDVFVINYENHQANTTAEYYKTCEVERAE